MEHLNQSSSNTSSSSLKPQVATGVLGICFLLGVPANIAVMVFLLRHLKKDNFTRKLMLNLAASDILRLVLVPLWVYNLNFGWALGRAICKLLYLLVFISSYGSVLTVTVMSVQRYVVVLHQSQWAKLGSKGEKLLLISLWTVALTLSISEAVKAVPILTKEQNVFCYQITDEDTLGILLCETLLGFVLPFSIMAMFYFCLHKKVKETPFFSNPRLAQLVIAILVTFFILWFPCHVLNILKILGLALKSSNPLLSNRLQSFWDSGHGVAQTITVFHSSVNPVLYAWSFRKHFQNQEKSKGNVLTRLRI